MKYGNLVLAALLVCTGSACSKSETAKHADGATIKVASGLAASKLIGGDLKTLIVQADDLPGSFSMVGGDRKSPNSYSHVYFNPQSLLSENPDEAGLLGVMVDLVVFDSAELAQAKYTSQASHNAEAVKADIRRATPGAVPQSVVRYAVNLDQADKVMAFHVRYILQGTNVQEYRFRVVVANTTVNLIVSAKANRVGHTPDKFEEQALAIIARQVARLRAAQP